MHFNVLQRSAPAHHNFHNKKTSVKYFTLKQSHDDWIYPIYVRSFFTIHKYNLLYTKFNHLDTTI